MALQSASVDELLEELRLRACLLEECDNSTLVYEVTHRIGLTEQEVLALADCVSTVALVRELLNRCPDHGLQMDMASMLDSPAQLEAMRLWLPMDGLDDEALWNSMSEKGRRHYLRTGLSEVLEQLRHDVVNAVQE